MQSNSSDFMSNWLYNHKDVKLYWGETQGALSVLIGLNLGYYAFWSSRQSHVSKLGLDIDKLSNDILKGMHDCDLVEKWERDKSQKSPVAYQHIHKKLFLMWNELSELSSQAKPFIAVTNGWPLERRIATLALSASAISFIFLVYSTLHFSHRVPVWLFLVLLTIGTVAFLINITLNYIILWTVLSNYRSTYYTLWTSYIRLIGEMDSLHVANARAALREL